MRAITHCQLTLDRGLFPVVEAEDWVSDERGRLNRYELVGEENTE